MIVDNKLIVNPGVKGASVAALDRRCGKVLWKSPGEPAAYSTFIVGSFGNVRQIVGYDAISLGGWDPDTGRRLWKLVPKEEGDFNVPTPVNIDGRLLVTTENNGTRLYEFDKEGRIQIVPVAQNLDLVSNCSSPVAANGLVFGCSGKLFCLDTSSGLRTLWSYGDRAFDDYVLLIAGNDHVLVTTIEGELILIRANEDRRILRSRLSVFKDAEVWSHPALVRDYLYIRNQSEVCCVLLEEHS